MLTVILISFVAALLFNLYTVIWGRQDLAALKQKISLGKYWKEMWAGLEQGVGKKVTIGTKIFLALFCVFAALTHIFSLLLGLAAVMLGFLTAKKLWQIGSVNNVLNKVATYINRMR